MKTYPNRDIENAARRAGARVTCLWEIPGPKDTGIAWMSALSINGAIAIVQTYKDGGGYEVFTPTVFRNVDETVKYIMADCVPEAVL